MLIPFGVLSAAGAGVVGGDYELISTTVLGTATSSVTFSSLGDYSSTYKHLQIRLTARNDRTGTAGDGISLTINGDTGANYADHDLRGTGSVVDSFARTSANRILLQRITTSADTANAFGAMVVDFLDSYSTTKNKTIRSFGGYAIGQLFLNSGFRNNTASITSITLTSATGPNFVTGSRFSLYGIKG